MEVIGIWLMLVAVVAELWCVKANAQAVRDLYKEYAANDLTKTEIQNGLTKMHMEQHSKIISELDYKIQTARLERDRAQKLLDQDAS